jgi:glycosyltransferase involved in cell wall biosynthesis
VNGPVVSRPAFGSQPRRTRLLLYTQNQPMGGVMGGMERHMELIARHIDHSRFDVFCVCPDFPTMKPLLEAIGPHCTDAVALTFNFRHLPGLPAFVSLLRRWRIDVVHIHNGYYLGQLSAMLAARLAGVRKIYMTEHIAPDKPEPWPIVADRWLMTSWLDGMICVSQKNLEARSKFLYTPRDRTFVVDNGVDTDDFVPIAEPELAKLREKHDLPADAQIVGVVVRLESDKGVRYLIDAFPQILASCPRAYLLIVGDGTLRAELEAQVASLGVRDRVRFVGFQADPRPYLGLMDVFVLPVPVGSMSIALLEAMAMRCAVVMTFGGPGEAVIHDETGLCAEPKNPRSIAENVTRILLDPDVQRRLANAARRHVEERFSSRVTARKLEEIYLRP